MNLFTPQLETRQPVAARLLSTAISRQALSHAYLFTGAAETDKWEIATSLACHLNCTSKQKSTSGSCALELINSQKLVIKPGVKPDLSLHKGLCQNCRWILAGAHPQAWFVLEGDETKTGKIPVEKARLLSLELSKTSQYVRVVVIPQGSQDTFHRPAANALLKTIEEPGTACLFLIFAKLPEDVLPTIVSRCQIVPLLAARHKEVDPEEAQKIEVARKELQSFASSGKEGSAVFQATSSPSRTVEWSQLLFNLSDGDLYPDCIIDLIVSDEIERCKSNAASNPELSWYLAQVMDLAEVTKSQIDHYVPLKAAMESFAWGCHRLWHRQLEEVGLGQKARN